MVCMSAHSRGHVIVSLTLATLSVIVSLGDKCCYQQYRQRNQEGRRLASCKQAKGRQNKDEEVSNLAMIAALAVAPA